MSKIHVKTGDTVVILNGRDRGKKGKILAVSPKEGKVIVEGANFVSKHVKPRRMGEPGGIIKPTRVAHKIYEDGTKERICKKCGESL